MRIDSDSLSVQETSVKPAEKVAEEKIIKKSEYFYEIIEEACLGSKCVEIYRDLYEVPELRDEFIQLFANMQSLSLIFKMSAFNLENSEIDHTVDKEYLDHFDEHVMEIDEIITKVMEHKKHVLEMIYTLQKDDTVTRALRIRKFPNIIEFVKEFTIPDFMHTMIVDFITYSWRLRDKKLRPCPAFFKEARSIIFKNIFNWSTWYSRVLICLIPVVRVSHLYVFWDNIHDVSKMRKFCISGMCSKCAL